MIRLVVLAMVETIERISDERSSALAWHAAIIMKSLINLIVEVVSHCSTLGIDYAEQLVGLGTANPTIKIYTICNVGAHRLHLRCRLWSSRSRARIVEALQVLKLLMSRLMKTFRRLRSGQNCPETQER